MRFFVMSIPLYMFKSEDLTTVLRIETTENTRCSKRIRR